MNFSSLLSTIACLTVLLAIGFFGGKIKLLDESATHHLSALIIKIGQPFLIINSIITQKCTPDKLREGLTVFALGLVLHAAMALLAYFLAKPIGIPDERKLSEYSMFFSNCGFMGFPVIQSLYGDDALFCGAFYLMSFHLFVWTYGLVILARGREDIKITPKKILLNYGTVPCAIGFLLFATQIPLPGFVYSVSSYLAELCTPIAMLIAGANIARRSMKKMLTRGNLYYTSAVKLIIMPLITATVLYFIGLPDYLVIFATVMAAMPSASVITMFGEMYSISPGCAAELVGTSTIFSTATIVPVVSYAIWLCGLR